MADLTKRERVLGAFKFQETDQIPVYDILQSDAIIAHYSRQTLNFEHADQLKGIAIGNTLDMTSMPEGPRPAGIERRPDGMVIQQERWSRWVAYRPFETLIETTEWLKNEITAVQQRSFDQAYRRMIRSEIQRFQAYFAEGDPDGRQDAAVLAVESAIGLSELYWLLGSQHFLTVIGERPALVDEWIETRSQMELRRIEAIADANLFPVVCIMEDIVTKSGVFYSPDWLQVHWIPKLKQIVHAWHQHDTLVVFRSQGNLMPFLPDLVAAGIDGLSPLEGMPVRSIRDQYPGLVLLGGIDSEQLLAYATPDEVRKVCQDTIVAAARKGYFLGSSAGVNWETQVENYAAMIDSSKSKADRPAPSRRRF